MLFEYLEGGALFSLTVLYLVPASIVLSKYRKNLDGFSFWMILVYLFGFICKPDKYP